MDIEPDKLQFNLLVASIGIDEEIKAHKKASRKR
jgi:hypothetical protein